MNEQQEAYARAVADFTEKVHAIRPDQWTDPTPCTEWDVRALVNHLTYENLWVPELIGGRTVAEVGDRFDGDVLGDDPVDAWDRSAKGAVEALTADGALDRTVDTSAGPTPASDYLDQIFVDAVIHGWDLARGTNAEDTIRVEFADELFSAYGPREAELRSYGVYGSTVVPPDGANTQTKLLAVFGRVQ